MGEHPDRTDRVSSTSHDSRDDNIDQRTKTVSPLLLIDSGGRERRPPEWEDTRVRPRVEICWGLGTTGGTSTRGWVKKRSKILEGCGVGVDPRQIEIWCRKEGRRVRKNKIPAQKASVVSRTYLVSSYSEPRVHAHPDVWAAPRHRREKEGGGSERREGDPDDHPLQSVQHTPPAAPLPSDGSPSLQPSNVRGTPASTPVLQVSGFGGPSGP